MRTHEEMTFIYRTLRIAEHAHRGQRRGVQYRKAPAGTDQPAYFVHLTEVAMRLMNCGQDAEVVAAGFLHDTIEDTDLTAETLLATCIKQQTGGGPGAGGHRTGQRDRAGSGATAITSTGCAPPGGVPGSQLRGQALQHLRICACTWDAATTCATSPRAAWAAQLAKYEALAEVYTAPEGAPPALFEPFLAWLERMRAFARR